VRIRPAIELTRRAAAGRRREATTLAAIVVVGVALRYAGRPLAEVRSRLRRAVDDAGLALTPASLHAVAESISDGDRWADLDI
jgi:hypothetical protein